MLRDADHRHGAIPGPVQHRPVLPGRAVPCSGTWASLRPLLQDRGGRRLAPVRSAACPFSSSASARRLEGGRAVASSPRSVLGSMACLVPCLSHRAWPQRSDHGSPSPLRGAPRARRAVPAGRGRGRVQVYLGPPGVASSLSVSGSNVPVCLTGAMPWELLAPALEGLGTEPGLTQSAPSLGSPGRTALPRPTLPLTGVPHPDLTFARAPGVWAPHPFLRWHIGQQRFPELGFAGLKPGLCHTLAAPRWAGFLASSAPGGDLRVRG